MTNELPLTQYTHLGSKHHRSWSEKTNLPTAFLADLLTFSFVRYLETFISLDQKIKV